METGSLSPLSLTPPAASPRADTLAASGAMRTELKPDAVVTQVGDAGSVRFAPSPGAQARALVDAAFRERVDRDLSIDPDSRAVIFQATDTRTGEVVRQIPDEALLRLRAYARDLREGAADAESRAGKVA
jgi:hypothetical protein